MLARGRADCESIVLADGEVIGPPSLSSFKNKFSTVMTTLRKGHDDAGYIVVGAALERQCNQFVGPFLRIIVTGGAVA